MISAENHYPLYHAWREAVFGTIRTIAEMQPGTTVIEDGLSLSRNSVPDAQRDVEEWVAGLGL